MTFAQYPSLNGRVAFVSGGATGIGADIVQALARNGAKVAFVDVDEKAGAALASKLDRDGAAALFLTCDVTDIEALRNALETTRSRLGPVGVLVNNAARDDRHETAEVDVEYWDRALNVNLRHHFFAAQAVQPHMKDLGHGSIINLGSIAWRRAGAEFPAYATAKAGIFGLTQALARAFGKDNIRVNSIEPGAVLTERQKRLWFQTEEALDSVRQRQLLKETLLGDDIARMALFLAADDSRMITSQSFTVDGGR